MLVIGRVVRTLHGYDAVTSFLIAYPSPLLLTNAPAQSDDDISPVVVVDLDRFQPPYGLWRSFEIGVDEPSVHRQLFDGHVQSLTFVRRQRGNHFCQLPSQDAY